MCTRSTSSPSPGHAQPYLVALRQDVIAILDAVARADLDVHHVLQCCGGPML